MLICSSSILFYFNYIYIFEKSDVAGVSMLDDPEEEKKLWSGGVKYFKIKCVYILKLSVCVCVCV